MLLPSVTIARQRRRRDARASCHRAMEGRDAYRVIPDSSQLRRYVSNVLKEYAIDPTTANGAGGPFDEWTRCRCLCSELDVLNVQDPPIPQPAMEPKQRVVIQLESASNVHFRLH
jgi:hypothetical protein